MDPDCGHRGFVGGAGFYYFRPVFFGANTAFVSTINQTVANPNTTQTQSQDFRWDYNMCRGPGWVTSSITALELSPITGASQGVPSGLSISHPADQPGVQTFGSTLAPCPFRCSRISPLFRRTRSLSTAI